MSRVSLVRCEDYDYEKVKSAVEKSIDLAGGLESIITKDSRVILKVNVLKARPPEDAVTTHPAVVKAVAEKIIALGATPVVGDTENSSMDRGKKSLDESGIRAVCDELGIECIDFKIHGYKKIDAPKAEIMRDMWLAKDIIEEDTVISLPKLKTHTLTRYTGAIKNFFGCIPMGERMRAHMLGRDDRFETVLCDIYSAVKPSFCVMDAIIGMEGDGPAHGTPKNFGFLAAGQDCVSVDAVCSALIGINDLPACRLADSRGLGSADLSLIEIAGDEIERFNIQMPKQQLPAIRKIASHLPPRMMDCLSRMISFSPAINPEKCKKCGACNGVCPAGAITNKTGEYPVFDHDRCIRCFCCHELCPEGAITLKKSFLSDIARRF